MTKPKLYFNYTHDEFARTEAAWRLLYEDTPGYKLKFIEVEKDTTSGFSWCTEHSTPIERGDCGKKVCNNYTPRNGINGKCKFKRSCYDAKLDEHGKPIIKTITI